MFGGYVKLEIDHLLDETFAAASFPIEDMSEHIDLIHTGGAFVIVRTTERKDTSLREYHAFDTEKEGYDWLDMMGFRILS